MLQEISENYSAKFDNTDKKNHFGIIWDFNRYAAFIETVDDLVYKVSEIAKQLELLTQKGTNKNDPETSKVGAETRLLPS